MHHPTDRITHIMACFCAGVSLNIYSFIHSFIHCYTHLEALAGTRNSSESILNKSGGDDLTGLDIP